MAPSAYAAPLNFATAESISIASPATTLMIATGSMADTLQVNATSVAVTLSSSTGGTFTLLSPSYDLSVATSSGGTVSSSCSTQGVVSTTISQSTGSTIYTITPSGTTCSGSVGLPAINSFSARPSSITAGQSSILSWTVTNASTTSLNNGIGNVTNETSTSVSPSQTTTYTLTATNGSGSSTTAMITVTVTPVSSGGGGGTGGGASVGVASQYGSPVNSTASSASTSSQTAATSTAMTSSTTLEAQLQSLLALLASLQAKAAQHGITPGTGGSITLFTTSLQFRDTGQAVTHLQQFLSEDKALYPSGRITGYFGSLTLAAVERFQEKYEIGATGDAGYGFVGPKTLAKLNSLVEVATQP